MGMRGVPDRKTISVGEGRRQYLIAARNLAGEQQISGWPHVDRRGLPMPRKAPDPALSPDLKRPSRPWSASIAQAEVRVRHVSCCYAVEADLPTTECQSSTYRKRTLGISFLAASPL